MKIIIKDPFWRVSVTGIDSFEPCGSIEIIILIPPSGDTHGLNLIDAVGGKPGKAVPDLENGQIPDVQDIEGMTSIGHGRDDIAKLQVLVGFRLPAFCSPSLSKLFHDFQGFFAFYL